MTTVRLMAHRMPRTCCRNSSSIVAEVVGNGQQALPIVTARSWSNYRTYKVHADSSSESVPLHQSLCRVRATGRHRSPSVAIGPWGTAFPSTRPQTGPRRSPSRLHAGDHMSDVFQAARVDAYSPGPAIQYYCTSPHLRPNTLLGGKLG